MYIPEDIFASSREGDRKGQEALYRLCYPLLMRMLFRYIPHESDTADVLNMAMFKALSRFHQFEGNHTNCFAWIKRIAVNEALDWLRKNKRLPDTLPLEHPQSLGLSMPVDTAEAKEWMQKVLAQLPLLSATIFNLHVMEGYSHSEIAAQLSVSVANSKWHVHVVRKKLKELLTSQRPI
jgi:RNA polymerase sigma-70 factor (ECF subfamily)